MSDSLEAIACAVRKGDQLKTVDLVKRAIDADVPARDVLARGLIPGMQALVHCLSNTLTCDDRWDRVRAWLR